MRRRLPPMLFQKLAKKGEEGDRAAALSVGGHERKCVGAQEPSGSCALTLLTGPARDRHTAHIQITVGKRIKFMAANPGARIVSHRPEAPAIVGRLLARASDR